jgi:hypothetical protein
MADRTLDAELPQSAKNPDVNFWRPKVYTIPAILFTALAQSHQSSKF